MRRLSQGPRASHEWCNAVCKPLTVVSVVALILGISFFDSSYSQFPMVQAGAETGLGEKIYMENCAACHGQRGDGKGPEASGLQTKPRDFTTGNYKFRSTPSGSLPLDQDIFRTISQGVRATSMLAQLHLSEPERWAVTQYLKTFSKRFKTEKPLQPIAIPAAPSPSRDLITLGRRMYTESGCSQCHGAEGKGNAPSANELKDESGNSIIATDLTLKPFKSGPGAEDLTEPSARVLMELRCHPTQVLLHPKNSGLWSSISFPLRHESGHVE
jgi:mono/diheme cytochrome c family protein